MVKTWPPFNSFGTAAEKSGENTLKVMLNGTIRNDDF